MPLAALLIDVVLTALWPIVAQAGTALYDGALFTEAGMLVGLAALAPWLLKDGRWRRLVDPELRRSMFWMGLFGSGLSTFLFISAVKWTTPANAAITAQVEVFYSAAMCAWLLGERISGAQAAGAFLVVAGTGLILGHDLASPRWRGDLLILLTPWMYQVSHIHAKRLPRDLDAVTISGARMLYGAVSLAPVAALSLLGGARWSWSPAGLGLVALQGVGMCALNHLLWYVAIRRMDLSKATTIILSYPAFTVLFSWALGREAVGPAQLAGLALTLAGAYVVSLLVLKGNRPLPVGEGGGEGQGEGRSIHPLPTLVE